MVAAVIVFTLTLLGQTDLGWTVIVVSMVLRVSAEDDRGDST
jgi:hypothetical protein